MTYSINGTTYQVSTIFSAVSAGSYNVTAKSAAGCISQATVAVLNIPPTVCAAGIYHTPVTCTDYKNTPGGQLVGQLCYTTKSNKVSNVTPGQFFYYTAITAPSASFCIDIVQTKSYAGLAFFQIQQGSQVYLWDGNCVKAASGTQVSIGQGRICITNAVPGVKYVLSVKYDSKSVIGSSFTGAAPICTYTFESKINNVSVVGSKTSINMSPNCTSGFLRTSGSDPVIESAPVSKDEWLVSLSPNPTPGDFKLNVTSSRDEAILVRVFNVYGRNVRDIKANTNEIISFGNDLKQGIYVIEVIQGDKRKSMKALKL
jgi:hypothetical protein